MDFSRIYNGKLSTLYDMKDRIEEKIFQKEVEMLVSQEFEPKLIEWITNNLNEVMLYIPHVRSEKEAGNVLGEDSDGYTPVHWDYDYIKKVFPEDDRFGFIENYQDDLTPWEVCQIAIELVPGHVVNLVEDEMIHDSYNYSIDYMVVSKYSFMADILERLLMEHRELIWNNYYEAMK